MPKHRGSNIVELDDGWNSSTLVLSQHSLHRLGWMHSGPQLAGCVEKLSPLGRDAF